MWGLGLVPDDTAALVFMLVASSQPRQNGNMSPGPQGQPVNISAPGSKHFNTSSYPREPSQATGSDGCPGQAPLVKA